MFDRMKRIIVESFVGAIALGIMLEQLVLSFVNILTAPVARWLSPSPSAASVSTSFPFQAAVPNLVEFAVLLPVWYLLLRWLYFTPSRKEMPEQASPQPIA